MPLANPAFGESWPQIHADNTDMLVLIRDHP